MIDVEFGRDPWMVLGQTVAKEYGIDKQWRTIITVTGKKTGIVVCRRVRRQHTYFPQV